MPERDATPDHRIAALAACGHGVVSHGQLRALGLTEHAIAWRAECGRLHRLHTGVYAVGHTRLGAAGRRLAAVLACGPGAAISHATAADHLDLRPSASPVIHVTVPTTAGRTRPGIRVHRSRRLPPWEITIVDGVPVTTPARTLADLAPSLSDKALRQVVERAVKLDVFDLRAIEDCLSGRAARRLRRAIAVAGPAELRSPLESDFLALCRSHGIRPLPQAGVLVAGKEADFFWPAAGLVVEIDGWSVHGGRTSFTDDRRRDVRRAVAGFTTLRFTHDDLADRPAGVAADVNAVLAQGRARWA
jgi:very-short-patch-repair endonuclease